MILKCTCRSDDQDQRYGVGKRLMNDCKPKEKVRKHFRCTVCRTVRTED